MKNFSQWAAAALLGLIVSTAASFAVAADKAMDPKSPNADGMGAMSMNPEQMQQMQQSMIKMHDLMHKIQKAKTPQERERLQRQHMHMMRSQMQTMMPMMQDMGGQGEVMDRKDDSPMSKPPSQQ